MHGDGKSSLDQAARQVAAEMAKADKGDVF